MVIYWLSNGYVMVMGYIGGSIVMGIPQALWMAYIVENPTKMDDN